MNSYKKVEAILYNYKRTEAEIENLKLKIDEIKNNYDGVGAISYEEKSAPTNKFNSSVENEVTFKDKQIKRILKQINYKEIQKICKVSSKYLYAYYGDKELDEKCLRVFASRSRHNTGVFKQKTEEGTLEKIASTPAKCFIDNSDVSNKTVPRKLDKQWYINVAWKRIRDFIGE